MLAAAGTQLHRRVKVPDIVIAAVAGRTNLTLVHYDQDYDTIGAAIGQAMRWAAPRGTLS
jgi:predicted nucleic acid-binding protein